MSYAPRQHDNDLFDWDDPYTEQGDWEPDPDLAREMAREREEWARADLEEMRWQEAEQEARESIWKVPMSVIKQGYDAIVAWEREQAKGGDK